MKNRQFRVLVTLIIAQTFFLFYKFHGAQEYNYKLYTETLNNAYDITHIKNTTDFIQEITAKHINGID